VYNTMFPCSEGSPGKYVAADGPRQRDRGNDGALEVRQCQQYLLVISIIDS
jgi:hypothetical protein